MRAEPQRQAFFREMDKLRGRPKPIEPSDIALVARKVGFPPHEALLQIQDYAGYGQPRSSEVFNALTIFISSLCNQAKVERVLEYTAAPSLLTARLAEGHEIRTLTYIAPYEHIAKTLHILFDEKVVKVLQSTTALTKGSVFDAIVCAPPLGNRAQKDSGADSFGGEVVRQLVPLLAEGGTLYWVTGRAAASSTVAKKTFADLHDNGLNSVAVIDVAPGGLPGTIIEGVVIVLRREAPAKRFVGALRDIETAESMASAFLARPSGKAGGSWTWLEAEDQRTFLNLEHSRLLQNLTPRGRHTAVSLSSLLLPGSVEKADSPVPNETAATFLFIPEYAGSRVTVDLEEQTVKPKALYRLPVDPAKANPRFLARLLNSPYGKQLRADAASGATIQRLSAKSLLALELPIPDMATQDRIARVDSDIGLLQAAFRDMQATLDHDWTDRSDLAEKIDGLKAVLDIERQIVNWWRELPYPLATIYRRYQVSQDPKDRLETLLHFFEMAAVYLAAVGASHIKAMRKNWQEVLPKLLHPPGTAGIERADFGFWIGLAGASLKDASRIASDKELREKAIEIAGPELVPVASTIGQLGKATEVLDIAGRHRNSWIGHGGHMKSSDAARLDVELQQSVRDLYEITASLFRRFYLVRPGMAEVTDTGFKFQIEKLTGSDPTFETEIVKLDRPAKSKSLAFWMRSARTMCHALPFFRLGLPQQPQESSFYVFNRVENGGFRWISYQEAREQEFIAPDDELHGIIALGRNAM
jgi:hypothetical protein